MGKPKFTPEPWMDGNTDDGERLILGGLSRSYVANIQIYQTPRKMGLYAEETRMANADLIITAPELYRELEMVMRKLNYEDLPNPSDHQRINALLAKARGEK